MQNSIVYQQSTQTGPRNGFSERTHGSVFALKDYASCKQQFPRTPRTRNTYVTFFEALLAWIEVQG